MKIALFLFSDYTKSWLDSGILSELSSHSELVIYGHKDVIAKINKQGLRVQTIAIPEFKKSRSTQHLQMVSLINRRVASSSFAFRLRRLMFGDLRFFQRRKTILVFLFAVFYNFKRLARFILSNPIEFIAFFRPFGILIECLLRRKFVFLSSKKFQNIPLDDSIELAILPSAAIEHQIYEFIEYLKTTTISSAICIENWDNLTSKSILISIPDYVFVMGSFCKSHGVTIQGLEESQIVVAGLPRFNPYRGIPLKSNESNLPKKSRFRILYLGFSVPHNEKNLINEIIKLLDASEMKDKYEFFYKPHPARQLRFYELDKLPPIVHVIDGNPGLSGFSAIPMIGPEHIQNILDADVVISTPTSMAIETMMLNVPIIVDATDDGVHRTTASSSLKEYLHLRDLQRLEHLPIAASPSELLDLLLGQFLGYAPYTAPNLENLIELKASNYASHILNLANRL
jgi:hypothetical protein